MMTIKTEECLTLFSELKAGDIFSFVVAPDIVYIKTNNNYFLDIECEDCGEETSINLDDYCVELATGALCEGNSYDKVFLYKKAELTLSR